MTGQQRIRTKLSDESAAIPQPANSEPSSWRLKPLSVKSLQPRDSTPAILVLYGRSSTWRTAFFRLGQPEGSGSELRSGLNPKRIDGYVWARAGHRTVIILTLPYMSSLNFIPRPLFVFRQLKAVTKASNKPDTRMQSLSLRTAILKRKSLKKAVGEMHSLVQGKRELRWSSRVGQQL